MKPSDDKRTALEGESKRSREREALERFVNKNAKVLVELAKQVSRELPQGCVSTRSSFSMSTTFSSPCGLVRFGGSAFAIRAYSSLRSWRSGPRSAHQISPRFNGGPRQIASVPSFDGATRFPHSPGNSRRIGLRSLLHCLV